MLTFNHKDYNLKLICSRLKSALNEFKTKSYFVYGIKIEDGAKKRRPHILIKSKEKIPTELINLFDRSNLKVVVNNLSDKNTDITIGLRKDVRKNIQFSKNIIKTIIFAFEGKLIIDNGFTITHSVEE